MIRTCSTCTACCTAIGVRELNKAPGVPCSDLVQIGWGRGPGCGRYDTRPNDCRIFECAWLQGHFSDEHRPDKLGLVFWVALPEITPPEIPEMMIAAEAYVGAAKEHTWLITTLRDLIPVAVLPFGVERVDMTLEELTGKK